MFTKAEEIYEKFNEEIIQIMIPKKILFTLLQQVDRVLELLSNEGVASNFAIYDYISNAEMLMVKLYILIAEPYEKKEIILDINLAEFLVLRDLVFCNYYLPHLRTKMGSQVLDTYKEFHDEVENIFGMLDNHEVKLYWNYIKNCKIKGAMLH